LLQSTGFRIGISDYRGDGRPDYRYHARVLYADSISPARASAAGGTAIAIAGLGFQQNTQPQIAGANVPLLVAAAQQILISAPAQPDRGSRRSDGWCYSSGGSQHLSDFISGSGFLRLLGCKQLYGHER
jgi:hypothetical protein